MFFWDEELVLSKNWPGDELFKLRKSKIWVRHFFLIVTLKQIFDIPSHKSLLISFCNVFISLTELKKTHQKHPLKERKCKFEIDKITYSKLEQRITLLNISLKCTYP